ncbi:MAG: S1 RNA-binding domain-containing protein [Anaerolineales bacterium]
MNENKPQTAGGTPIDEGWWAAVLQEEEDHFSARRAAPRAGPSGGGDPAADWQAARQLYEADEPVELDVMGYNRGGLLVGFHSLQGFVPASHLVNFPNQVTEEDRMGSLSRKVGMRLKLKVIEYDPAKGRVVFSERAAQAGPGSRTQVLNSLRPGSKVDGVVTNVCDFGAFVDLGGIEGLIHVSEVSWSRVGHPRDVLACNQKVQVSVLSVDADQGRVALSLKRLRPDPWANVDQRYRLGQILEGTVTNVVNFGAFVGIEEGLEGLIHVSELADGHFLHPRNVVREGDHVRACIVSIDGPGRRLGLSLRRLSALEMPAVELVTNGHNEVEL